jgi:hypothetical protein
VLRTETSDRLLLLGAGAFFIDMFLRWGPRQVGGGSFGTITGWELQIGNLGVVVLALALVELVRLWRTRTSALLGLMLGGSVAALGIGTLIHMRWAGPIRLQFDQFGYGAWIALGLSLVVLAGTLVRLAESRQTTTTRLYGSGTA